MLPRGGCWCRWCRGGSASTPETRLLSGLDARHGLPRDALLALGETAAVRALKEHCARAPEPPDVVLLGGAGPEYSHLTLSWVYDWMAQGVPVVAMHRSTAWTTTDGLRVDTGMYLIGMEQTSGRKATAVGKPAPEGFLSAASRLGVDAEEMYMVGDDLNNDVLAGQVVGMTGVLVRTGKFRQDTLDRWAADEFAMQPNHVIDSVADLPALLGL